MSDTKANEFTPFHSSVNRIPSIRTQSSKIPKSYKWGILGDQTPVPISEVTHEQLSGSISVTATVETPLIIGSVQRTKTQATKSNPSREIKTLSPHIVDDRAFIPPTMFKGMLSNAFEALTNSRYRMFDPHNTPLTYRIDPATSTSLMPVRIVHSENEQTTIEILDGSHSHRDYVTDGNRDIPITLTASLYDGTSAGISLREHIQSPRSNHPTPGRTGTRVIDSSR